MAKPEGPELIAHYIKTVNEEGVNLNAWELGFMESVTEQFERSGRLSERQIEILDRIYATRTS